MLVASRGRCHRLERLQETLAELLTDRLAESSKAKSDHACACAAEILATFGTAFAEWRDANVRAGTPLDAFTDFDPGPIALCSDLAFIPGTADAVRTLLMDRYATYTEVSYRLRILVDALGALRNTYPTGTLHDCDEGDDDNPIRLSHTALGSNVR